MFSKIYKYSKYMSLYYFNIGLKYIWIKSKTYVKYKCCKKKVVRNKMKPPTIKFD